MTYLPPGQPLRQRQREQTKDEIEAAAFSLFDEQGFDATTVEQIARRAGIATRTFFRYFPTKEDVVFADQGELVARLRAALAETDPSQPPLRRVREAVLAVQQPGRRPHLQIARARLVSDVPAIRARSYHLVEALEDAVAEALTEATGGDEGTQVRARIVAGAVFGALRGARRAAGDLVKADPLQLVETAFAIVEDGAAAYFPPPATLARDGPEQSD